MAFEAMLQDPVGFWLNPNSLIRFIIVLIVGVLARGYVIGGIQNVGSRLGDPKLVSGFSSAVNLFIIGIIVSQFFNSYPLFNISQEIGLVFQVLALIALAGGAVTAIGAFLPQLIQQSGFQDTIAPIATGITKTLIFAVIGVHILERTSLFGFGSISFLLTSFLAAIAVLLVSIILFNKIRVWMPTGSKVLGLSEDLQSYALIIISLFTFAETAFIFGLTIGSFGTIIQTTAQLVTATLRFTVEVGILFALIVLIRKMR